MLLRTDLLFGHAALRSFICVMSMAVKRPLIATRIGLASALTLSCFAGACQKTDAPPGDRPEKDKDRPAAAASVKTTKSPAKPSDDQMKDVVIKTTAVAGPIYMLEGRGGNIGVSAGQDGVVLVDDQFLPLAPKIQEAVRALGKGDAKFVINTHWHGDHTGGNPEFGKTAPVIAHENVRKRVSTPQQLRGEVIEPLPAAGWPVVTFQQSASLHMNGEEIRLVHFPHGHTDGDTVVFFTGANVVHMGDHMFNGRFPFVDTESGGDPVQYAANVKAVLDQIKDDTRIIPGHGPLATRADLIAFHKMLVDTIETVRAGKKAGKSLADLQKAGLPEYASYGAGFIKTDVWIETLYQSLK